MTSKTESWLSVLLKEDGASIRDHCGTKRQNAGSQANWPIERIEGVAACSLKLKRRYN